VLKPPSIRNFLLALPPVTAALLAQAKSPGGQAMGAGLFLACSVGPWVILSCAGAYAAHRNRTTVARTVGFATMAWLILFTICTKGMIGQNAAQSTALGDRALVQQFEPFVDTYLQLLQRANSNVNSLFSLLAFIYGVNCYDLRFKQSLWLAIAIAANKVAERGTRNAKRDGCRPQHRCAAPVPITRPSRALRSLTLSLTHSLTLRRPPLHGPRSPS
jgi:hypothetical protein